MKNDFIKFESNIIAGPCSAESKRQVLTTVKELADENIKFIRFGIWKPRTKPGGFEVGNGSVVDMFEYAANQKSPRIGKPNRAILDLCLEYFGLKEDEIILIGDNLETDIKLGYEQNIETVLVQTGVHNKEDIERLKIYPTHVVNTLMDLVDYNFD